MSDELAELVYQHECLTQQKEICRRRKTKKVKCLANDFQS